MPLTHLSADAASQEVFGDLECDGCVVIDRVPNRATSSLLHVTEIIDLEPASAVQPIHRDPLESSWVRR
jgi:hypothetical protein